jgi:mono/diheme cytochrome c family protein
MTSPRRTSRAERDERIVASAGPWFVQTSPLYGLSSVTDDKRSSKGARALARIANRIGKRAKVMSVDTYVETASHRKARERRQRAKAAK